jgi:hypothetical protein
VESFWELHEVAMGVVSGASAIAAGKAWGGPGVDEWCLWVVDDLQAALSFFWRWKGGVELNAFLLGGLEQIPVAFDAVTAENQHLCHPLGALEGLLVWLRIQYCGYLDKLTHYLLNLYYFLHLMLSNLLVLAAHKQRSTALKDRMVPGFRNHHWLFCEPLGLGSCILLI